MSVSYWGQAAEEMVGEREEALLTQVHDLGAVDALFEAIYQGFHPIVICVRLAISNNNLSKVETIVLQWLKKQHQIETIYKIIICFF